MSWIQSTEFAYQTEKIQVVLQSPHVHITYMLTHMSHIHICSHTGTLQMQRQNRKIYTLTLLLNCFARNFYVLIPILRNQKCTFLAHFKQILVENFHKRSSAFIDWKIQFGKKFPFQTKLCNQYNNNMKLIRLLNDNKYTKAQVLVTSLASR
jgi:hypothetical protein